MDEGLTRPIGLIATYSLLREHDVKEVFILKNGKLNNFREKVKNVIFITRSFLTHMDMISENIHGLVFHIKCVIVLNSYLSMKIIYI